MAAVSSSRAWSSSSQRPGCWVVGSVVDGRCCGDTVCGEIRAKLCNAIAGVQGLAELRNAGDQHVRGIPSCALVIARTETPMAYNVGAVSSYREQGVDRGELLDGGTPGSCDECTARKGKIVSLEEALEIDENTHPNRTLAFAPILAGLEGEELDSSATGEQQTLMDGEGGLRWAAGSSSTRTATRAFTVVDTRVAPIAKWLGSDPTPPSQACPCRIPGVASTWGHSPRPRPSLALRSCGPAGASASGCRPALEPEAP